MSRKFPMSVTWYCDACGEQGQLIYDTPVTNDRGFADALIAHGLDLNVDDLKPLQRHLNRFRTKVRRNSPAADISPLFTRSPQ